MNDQEAPNVGQRVRDLRQKRGLSLRALAELCELSPNTISLVERGITSPSVSTLHRLATALGVPTAGLFDDPVEPTRVILTRADSRIRSGSGSVLLESLGYGLEDQTCEPFVVTLEPRASSGKQAMAHPGHELVFCLQGELEYEVNGDNYRLVPGDALLFHGNLPHRWRNPNSGPVIFLMIMGGIIERQEPVEQHLHP